MTDLGNDNPFGLMDAWLAEADKAEPNDPSAAALATVDAEGWPSVRIVLVRGHDDRSVRFFTNYTSRKAEEMDATGRAALCLHWKSLRRQIRLVGAVERLGDADSDAYYESRPYGSRIGAWASDQSSPLDSRETLEKRVKEFGDKYPESPPRPPHWGGYRLTPREFEFWMDGEHRLHDRFRFLLKDGSWAAERLYP